MTHLDIASELAAAHREEMLRLATRDRVVVTRSRSRLRHRLVAWLDAQRLGHRRSSTVRPTCAAVTR